MKSYEIQVIVEQDEDGMYVASCPSLQGCYTQAKTFEEVMKRIKDVVAMCIEELKEEGKDVNIAYPEVFAIKTLKVAV